MPSIDDRNPVFDDGAGIVVGKPTGGQLGVGTINATGLYVNGIAVAGGLAVPTSTLLGGNGSSLLGVALGTNLTLVNNVLNATGGGGTPGGSTGQIQVNSGGSFGGLPITGTGNVVLSNSPTLVTPALGTPSAVVLTNAAGLPISTGLSGLGTGVASGLALASTGTGGPVFATSPTITGLTLTGGTADNVVIGGVTPAAGTFTNLNFTGTLNSNGTTLAIITGVDTTTIASTSGVLGLAPIAAATLLGNVTGASGQPTAILLDSSLAFIGGKLATTGTLSQVNLTSATGLLLNGTPIINMTGNAQSIVIGPNAGVSLPTTDTESVAIGPNTLNAYGALTGENTVVGWFTARSLTGGPYQLVTTQAITASNTLVFTNTVNVNTGTFVVNPNIPNGTTVTSGSGGTNLPISNAVTLASGAVVQFASAMLTTSAATTANTVLTFASSTGASAGQVAFGSTMTGLNASGFANVLSVTSTTVTLDRPITVASGAVVYFSGASGKFNTAIGVNSMGLCVVDANNAMVGTDSMRNALGSNNAGLGSTVMRNGTHFNSVAIGTSALRCNLNDAANTSGNVAVGNQAMQGAGITTASNNIVIGSNTAAGSALTSASTNIIIGFQGAPALTTGSANIGLGQQVFQALTTGGGNVVIGNNSAQALNTGNSNTVLGGSAFNAASTAWFHVAVGANAMLNWAGNANSSGNGNVAVGALAYQCAAGANGSQNTILGCATATVATSASNLVVIGNQAGKALTTGGNNVIIGPQVALTTLATGTGNIYLGASSAIDAATSAESNTLRIGNNAVNVITSTAINTAAPTTIFGGITGTSVTTGITAHAGGGQASATALTTGYNHVTVCATVADSVKLPVTTIAGISITITNDTLNALQAFGAGTDVINNVATATGVSIPAGKTATFDCPVSGKWFGGTLT